jgi:hypothetical protein
LTIVLSVLLHLTIVLSVLLHLTIVLSVLLHLAIVLFVLLHLTIVLFVFFIWLLCYLSSSFDYCVICLLHLTVLLRLTDSDYHLWYPFYLFLLCLIYNIGFSNLYLSRKVFSINVVSFSIVYLRENKFDTRSRTL